ncbi:uncharacterized LOC100381827 [Zea mays]|uniref:Uncharacterized protein n=1 Tax=Zea mays TaxID=4577 RepID=C0HJ58_MAIZE|nr:uncharacterized LOC100381827 [Zea mays]ACN27061.1 unknown [Zea mays]|eukprot:NP_001168092.1 uncharacterized protein LOC100381827 [Zea mays]
MYLYGKDTNLITYLTGLHSSTLKWAPTTSLFNNQVQEWLELDHQLREQTKLPWDKRSGIGSLVLLRHSPEEIQALGALQIIPVIPGTKALQIPLERPTKQLPTHQRKRASCPGEGARRKCPQLRPPGRPLRGTAVTRTAGGSPAAVAAAGARPPRRGSTTREAPRTAGRPRAPPWPGTRPGGEAPPRGTTRRSAASSASPSPPAGGSELPRTTPTNSESGRRLLGRGTFAGSLLSAAKANRQIDDGWMVTRLP